MDVLEYIRNILRKWYQPWVRETSKGVLADYECACICAHLQHLYLLCAALVRCGCSHRSVDLFQVRHLLRDVYRLQRDDSVTVRLWGRQNKDGVSTEFFQQKFCFCQHGHSWSIFRNYPKSLCSFNIIKGCPAFTRWTKAEYSSNIVCLWPGFDRWAVMEMSAVPFLLRYIHAVFVSV